MFVSKLIKRNLVKLTLLMNMKQTPGHEIQIRHQLCTSGLNTFLPYCKFNNIKSVNKLYMYIKRTIFSGSSLFSISDKSENNSRSADSDEKIINDFIINELYHHPGFGQNVLLIQPRIKYGQNSERKIVSEVKMKEAVALVNTLPNWKVIEKCVLPVASITAPLMFGKGNLEKIKKMVHSNHRITAVFIGIDILTALQNAKLESLFKLQVFDRYQIILQIFHDHAHTNEAKLQLALAEIPYLRVKLCGFSHTGNSSTFQGMQLVGGDGESFMQVRKKLLHEREVKLKKDLAKIKNQRELLRRSEMRNSLPIVAVVGYTNCGKTSLIKSLTNDSQLVPEDKLFATLDVTLHAGVLPSNQKVLFIDTVGFISDVPTALIQSFRSTLEEINLADLVVHVRDISHPDTETQKKTVLNTLEELNLPSKLVDSIVEVKNKIDLLENTEEIKDESDVLCISATEGTGLSNLLEVVEKKLFDNTGHSITLIRIPNGGQEYSWLLREAAIRDAMADTVDANYLIVEVVITNSNLAKFKHLFGDLTITLESIS